MANFARLDLNRRLVMLRPINCSLVAGERAQSTACHSDCEFVRLTGSSIVAQLGAIFSAHVSIQSSW